MSDNLNEKRAALFDDFWAFHLAHPELRFWQAVGAWSGYCTVLATDSHPEDWETKPTQAIWGDGDVKLTGQPVQIRDTFYWETKDGNE